MRVVSRNIRLRNLLPFWIGCVLLPLPAVAFWHTEGGRTAALAVFFGSCSALVAYAFRREAGTPREDSRTNSNGEWSRRMLRVGGTLFVAFVGFSALYLAVDDAPDFVTVFLAFLVLFPSICLTPFLTLATRKPAAAVVLTPFLVGTMKLLGCTIVVLTYGWDASEHGHTNMPWTRPNLLVWSFWISTAVLCLFFCFLGAREWRTRSETESSD